MGWKAVCLSSYNPCRNIVTGPLFNERSNCFRILSSDNFIVSITHGTNSLTICHRFTLFKATCSLFLDYTSVVIDSDQLYLFQKISTYTKATLPCTLKKYKCFKPAVVNCAVALVFVLIEVEMRNSRLYIKFFTFVAEA